VEGQQEGRKEHGHGHQVAFLADTARHDRRDPAAQAQVNQR
jgi:hypothetical protein